jgi:hypothetical protein
MEGLNRSVGKRAQQREQNDALMGHAGRADTAAAAQGSGVLTRGRSKKRKGNELIEHVLPADAGAQAQGSAEFRTGDLGFGPWTAEAFPFLELPGEMQRLILGYVSLWELARLACLCKDLRTAYEERVGMRDAAVAGLLESHFTAEFREGLTPAQTALPYDLVVDPPVRRQPLVE